MFKLIWNILLVIVVVFCVFITVCKCNDDFEYHSHEGLDDDIEIGKLPHCVEEEDVGYILVSTLDGKLSALRANGEIAWEVNTQNGPLLASSIQSVELSNNGEWVKIIPSLSGSLYKFNGKTIDAIPINADNLLKSSFLYSSDIVIAGGRDVRTYGVIAKTGEMLYECSSDGCHNITQVDEEFDDIIVIERSTTTVRAHEPRTGVERWNFSVGYHNIKVPPASCINLDSAISSLNISAILPQGILCAKRKHQTDQLWKYAFDTPIVKIWKWDGRDLVAVDVFEQARPSEHALTSPAIYLGMHNKQLYIHESMRMLGAMQRHSHRSTELADANSWTRFPWKPVPAGHLQDEIDESTAMSVLYSSNYVEGNGFYFYTEIDIQRGNSILCEGRNNTSKMNGVFDSFPFGKSMFLTIGFIVMTAFATQFKSILCWVKGVKRSDELQRQTSATKSFESVATNVTTSSGSIYNDARPIQSHFLTNFNIISRLGKGGYGIVFKVQQKMDQAKYAVKIIPLPQREAAKERVHREVVALAQLDHQNIVRYSTSWHEQSLPDFSHIEHLKSGTDASIFSSDIYEEEDEEADDDGDVENARINISDTTETTQARLPISDADDDSYIVFEDETTGRSSRSNSTRITVQHEDTTTTTTTQTNESFSSPSNAASPLIGTRSSSETRNNVRRLSRKFSMDDPKSSGRERQYLFIQMQLCDEGTLKGWLTNNQDRSPATIYALFNQILSAVAYIHEMKLIHRDLKPSNIFFSSTMLIKVGDFGLVTPMQTAGCDKDLLGSQNCKHTCDAGTALYMSPEQKKGPNYNYKVDIFSLGVILFELIVFFGTESERIRTLQRLRDGKFPDEFHTNYPKEHDLLKLMLSESPDLRPSVIEVMDKIKANIYPRC